MFVDAYFLMRAYVYVMFDVVSSCTCKQRYSFKKATLLIQQPFGDIEVALPGWVNQRATCYLWWTQALL